MEKVDINKVLEDAFQVGMHKHGLASGQTVGEQKLPDWLKPVLAEVFLRLSQLLGGGK